jgi:hypothetical protein
MSVFSLVKILMRMYMPTIQISMRENSASQHFEHIFAGEHLCHNNESGQCSGIAVKLGILCGIDSQGGI